MVSLRMKMLLQQKPPKLPKTLKRCKARATDLGLEFRFRV